jgi:hypothetical protein
MAVSETASSFLCAGTISISEDLSVMAFRLVAEDGSWAARSRCTARVAGRAALIWPGFRPFPNGLVAHPTAAGG